MATSEALVADLVPLEDRLRWMLTYRAGMWVILTGGAALHVLSGDLLGKPLLIGLGWLAATALTVFVARLGRGLALILFRLSLFGDALYLGALRPHLEWLAGPVELVIVGHIVAVTLLASFRTGAQVTLMHTVVCFLVLEARSAGLLGSAVPLDPGRFLIIVLLLWLVMTATASYAAVNERELRRRRYDAERLHAFGTAVARSLDPATVAEQLVTFAREELLAHRAAVVVYPTDSDNPGTAWVSDQTSSCETTVAAHPARSSVLHKVLRGTVTVLTHRLHPEGDPILAALLPDAQHLIIVPFGGDELTGVLILEHARWSSQRTSRRVELRLIDTAEQASLQASLAISRAVLLAQAQVSAQTDGLTGLANRRTFDARLTEETALAAAGGPPVALIMIDLDHFKHLNDTYGHQAGDEVLRQSASALVHGAPNGAIVARYGGEEMAIILPRTDFMTALHVAEHLRVALETTARPVPVTASMGVASAPSHGATPAALLAAADAALYAAKQGGRNRVMAAPTQPVSVW